MTRPADLLCPACGRDLSDLPVEPTLVCPACAASCSRQSARLETRRRSRRRALLAGALVLASPALLSIAYVLLGRAQDYPGGHAVWLILISPSIAGWFMLLRAQRSALGAAWWIAAIGASAVWAIVATFTASLALMMLYALFFS